MTRRAHVAVASAVAAAIAGLGTACEGRPHGGLTQIRADAVPYPVARQRCFEQAMGAATGATGSGAARDRAFDLCMERTGWAYRRPAP